MGAARKTEALISLQEWAERSGMSMPFLRKALRMQNHPYYKIGGKIMIRESEGWSWIEQRKAQ